MFAVPESRSEPTTTCQRASIGMARLSAHQWKQIMGYQRRPRKTTRERMSEWVLHCAVNQRHVRRSQPTREAALKDACSQLLEGHAVNRIVGPNETITAEREGLVRKASILAQDVVAKF